MISIILYLLFYSSLGVALSHFGYSWLIIVFVVAQIVYFKLNQWLSAPRLTPEQRLGSLRALLRIRAAQIGAIYTTVYGYQIKIKVKGDSWIPLFMADCRSLSNYCPYDDTPDKNDKKYLQKAKILYKTRFNYDPFLGILEKNELAGIGLAALFRSSSNETTIDLLKSIPSDANLRKQITSLIWEYRLINFLTLNGNYHILFKNWKPLSSLIQERYLQLSYHWEKIWRAHQCAILTAKASNHDSSQLDNAWSEGQSLSDMETNLSRTLSKHNSQSSGWRDGDEIAFFRKLQSNPIWVKLHNTYLPVEE